MYIYRIDVGGWNPSTWKVGSYCSVLFILHCQYHGCWQAYDTEKSQGISSQPALVSHDILVLNAFVLQMMRRETKNNI